MLRLRFVFTGSDLLYAPWCLQAANLIEEMYVKKSLQNEMLQALTDLVTLANLAEHTGEEVHFSPYSPLMLHIRTLVDVVREENAATVPENLAAPAEQSHQHHQGQEPTCTPPQPGALDSPTHPPTHHSHP